MARCPFTILIDTNEQQPWTFQGICGDAKDDYDTIFVPYKFASLGRHPHSRGDYTIEGLGNAVAIERKSLEDVWGTVLGWESDFDRERNRSGRRDRFKAELANLSKIPCSWVIVEATFEQCMLQMPSWGVKPADVNRKIFNRSIISFEREFSVPWKFCDGRRVAEVQAFRCLEAVWRHEG